ncbi:hypothetical protein K1719_029956 [Acacia pycnantha]|nr:hypothetical protein K1719_029956 [Acacia pycnantha]
MREEGRPPELLDREASPILRKHETGLIEEIVKFVCDKLDYTFPSNFDYPVGDIQSKVDEIISLSKIGLDDICFVGIWGMPGVGKTFLARGFYDAVRGQFEASCFLRDVRKVSEGHSLACLQRMLHCNLGLAQAKDDSFEGARVIRRFLCRKKVLIILDDVSDISQLENLAGSENWFGPGSKIIITTRDKHLLLEHGLSKIYEVGTLDRDESLKLFCQKVFQKDEPEEGYLHLSEAAIEYAGGVPLVLVVLGSLLYRRAQSEWSAELHEFRKNLHVDIFCVFRISYDELEERYKMIFLDIACFFNGRTKFEVTNILEICGSHPTIGIKVLTDKSLLSFTQSNSNSRLTHYGLRKMRSDIFLPTFMYHKLFHEASQESLHMHNVLQEMGRSIVYNECRRDPGRRRRLWDIKDIDMVLKENMGTDAVESIVVDLRHPFKADWDPECFSKMRRLRLLDLSRVELAHNLNCLPCNLKFLRWHFYALESLPPVDQLRKLESLELRCSNIQSLWDRAPELHKLRTIELSCSDDLMETPDFSGTPNLQKLVFNYCDSLIRVHESVGQLKNLVELSLRYCTNLETLPNCLDINSLEVFVLGECLKLEKLPEFSKNMRRLYFLDVKGTKISEIPLSIINLENLKYLDLSACSELKSVPELPPNSIIRANKDPVLASAIDLQLLIESRFSKHPSVAKDPIHLVFDSKGKEDLPPWFEQQELRHSKDDLGEVVTITADIPGDFASSDGECWGIAVCIIFECPSEGAWRGFAVNSEFQDYPHTSDKEGGRPHRTHTNAGTQVDSTDETILSKKTVDDDDLLATIFSFEKNQQDEIESRVYKGFFPIDKEKCRQHPSGEGGQVHLTLSFPTTNTIGKVIIHHKETSFGDLEIVECGWRLVCKIDLDAS